ncbi:hypothetical protein Val02_44530 [Virgisporangium aliadipatigenens]|uniref:Flavin reductase n=1 Tax=Virgisporangium aliadipatigenens TaxID=741659 RepID=A0A8J3YNA5_9ACTN|nr:hypothetical protein [Virgisporangium aliadipatigenens]GIJ47567.1 hypothetical protein Val02_44530 [Virgisporangium aliadipatigenens]
MTTIGRTNVPFNPEHTPRRPDWTCRVCAQPWPCPTRKNRLRAEHAEHPVRTGLFLAACARQAAEDLHAPPEAMDDRMLHWLRGGRR